MNYTCKCSFPLHVLPPSCRLYACRCRMYEIKMTSVYFILRPTEDDGILFRLTVPQPTSSYFHILSHEDLDHDSHSTHVDSGFWFGGKMPGSQAVVFPSAGANVAGIWLPCLAPKWDWVCEGPVQGCVNDSFIQFLKHGWTWVKAEGVKLSEVWQAWLQSACQSASRFLSVNTSHNVTIDDDFILTLAFESWHN